MAGEGSDMIACYSPSTGTYSVPKIYLVGVENNPYVNGVSFDDSRHRLHVPWIYRQFIRSDNSNDLHRQQAGPNGPENNRDLAYAYSDDLGVTWVNTLDKDIGDKDIGDKDIGDKDITPDASGIIVRRMPRYRGILNQESQCVDRDGNFYVLMRDTTRTGEHEWMHTIRFMKTGKWK